MSEKVANKNCQRMITFTTVKVSESGPVETRGLLTCKPCGLNMGVNFDNSVDTFKERDLLDESRLVLPDYCAAPMGSTPVKKVRLI